MNDTEIEAAALGRLHEAMIAELGERGFDGIRLDAVLARAGVSEADFTATYDGVEECVFDAYASLTDRLDGVVRDACRDAGWPPKGRDWAGRVSAGLAALLAELARDPVRARVLALDFPAIGPHARVRFQAFVESFAPMLEGGRKEAENDAELPCEVETLAVGAAEAIIFVEIVAGQAARLNELLPAIAFSLLVPFIGPARARVEMEKLET
jgi:AcrR family transcriptional regulator